MPGSSSANGLFLALGRVPVSLLVEDTGRLKLALSALQQLGINDLDAYFFEHPQELIRHLTMAKLVFANNAALKTFGAANLDELSRSRLQTLSARGLERARKHLLRLAQGENTFCYETVICTLDGGEALHRLSCAPAPELGPDMLMTTLEDLSGKSDAASRAYEKARQTRRCFDMAPVPLSLWRKNGNSFLLADANHSALRQWDDAVLGKSLEELYPDPAAVRECLRAALNGEPIADGTLTCTAVDSGTVAAAQTTQPAADEPRHTSGQTAAPDLGSAKEWSMLAHASHEVRSPLAAILGLTELCEEEPDNCSHNLRLINNSARSLLALVDDVLEAAQAEGGRLKLTREPFSLTDLLSELSEECGVLARRKGLALHLELDDNLPEFVFGDSRRLRQVLVNLLSNGIKFTESGGVTLRAEPLKGALVRFTVADTGRGIPIPHHKAVFESYTRLDNGSRTVGAGLGLAIARRLVRAMDGDITLRSSPGLGTAFMVALALPATTPPEPMVAEPSPAAEDATLTSAPCSPERQVLLVEDNHLNQLVTKEMLRKLGHVVVCADNGGLALEQLRKSAFDLAVLDVQLPDVDGLEIARRIRNGDAGDHNRNLPVVALSAYVLDEERDHVLAAGFDAYLSKPVSRDVLQQTLEAVISAKKPRKNPGKSLSSAAPLAVDVFRRETPALLQELTKAVRSGAVTEAARLAHRMAGSAGALGARGLMRACQRLEEALRPLEAHEVDHRVERLAQGVFEEHAQVLRLLSEQPNRLPA